MGSWEGTCEFCQNLKWIRNFCDICGIYICEDCICDYSFPCDICGIVICDNCNCNCKSDNDKEL